MADASDVLAIVGGTLIDMTGAPPVADAVLLIEGGRIRAAGGRASVRIPDRASSVDARGKFVIPGLIDTNVHLTLFGFPVPQFEQTLIRYAPRSTEIAVAAAQLHLRHGITTVRDSYGVLPVCQAARTEIESGRVPGPRILAAGNIVGWGGPFSVTFGSPLADWPTTGPVVYPRLTRFEAEFNDFVTQGTGEELLLLTAAELGDAIDRYLDKGPDFIKYGGTVHWWYPTLIPFSAEAQRTIVDRAHRRGLPAETHATTLEGLRQSVEAGIDLIQHPETMNGPRELTDDLVRAIRERGVICSTIPGMLAGEAWTRHLAKEKGAAARHETEDRVAGGAPETAHGRRRRALERDAELSNKRRNVEKLIAAGCRITVGADTYIDAAPEFTAGSLTDPWFEPGLGVPYGLEALVELGMTPASALEAATRNAAAACRMEGEIGTLEAGKAADAVVLDADPLADIRNVRRIRSVVSRGRVVDPARLPERSVFERVT